MQKSDRFIKLETELLRLKDQFLPEISPVSSYSDRDIALTIAYIQVITAFLCHIYGE